MVASPVAVDGGVAAAVADEAANAPSPDVAPLEPGMVRLIDLVSTAAQRREWYWWHSDLLRRLGLPVRVPCRCDNPDARIVSGVVLAWGEQRTSWWAPFRV